MDHPVLVWLVPVGAEDVVLARHAVRCLLGPRRSRDRSRHGFPVMQRPGPGRSFEGVSRKLSVAGAFREFMGTWKVRFLNKTWLRFVGDTVK